jgi:hypothetical protein
MKKLDHLLELFDAKKNEVIFKCQESERAEPKKTASQLI